jgi:hypothetical protein
MMQDIVWTISIILMGALQCDCPQFLSASTRLRTK